MFFHLHVKKTESNLDQCHKKVRTIFWEQYSVFPNTTDMNRVWVVHGRGRRKADGGKRIHRNSFVPKLSLDSILKMLRTPRPLSTYPI